MNGDDAVECPRLRHDEILAHRGEVPNFASFLRVTCMCYLRRAADAAASQAPAPPRLAVVPAAGQR